MNTYIYVRPDGSQVGGYLEPAEPTQDQAEPATLAELTQLNADDSPAYADQIWLFPGWGPSPFKMKQDELDWQSVEMAAVANQLLALEEEAPDALPGSRKSWLQYRTSVRLWHESPDFPNQVKRPVRPS